MMQGRTLADAPETAAPDRGCRFWPRCVTCPFRDCVLELPARQRVEFTTAWQTVLKYVAPVPLPVRSA
jgi:hypothetical protein